MLMKPQSYLWLLPSHWLIAE
uniref:Uncharacterized protein n=1 Tax=Anguilla anguilla TaxID=7936 RepID=A0A0E9QUA5_ANGAN